MNKLLIKWHFELFLICFNQPFRIKKNSRFSWKTDLRLKSFIFDLSKNWFFSHECFTIHRANKQKSYFVDCKRSNCCSGEVKNLTEQLWQMMKNKKQKTNCTATMSMMLCTCCLLWTFLLTYLFFSFSFFSLNQTNVASIRTKKRWNTWNMLTSFSMLYVSW